MPSLEEDVAESLSAASRCSRALDDGLKRLRVAVAEKDWPGVETIRTELVAAVDGYVDHYAAAGRRTELARDW